MTRVCSKFCSVRAYLRSPVWFGSPSRAQIPNLPCSVRERISMTQLKQEAYGPCLTHLSEIATADMPM